MEGFKQNFDSASEQEPFNVEKSMERERTMLGKFRGKTKDIARVLLFVSALSAGYGFTGRASEAGETERSEKPAYSQKTNIESERKAEFVSRFEAFKDSVVERKIELHNLQEAMYELRFLYQHHKEDDEGARRALETWIFSNVGNSKEQRTPTTTPKEKFLILNDLHYRVDQFVDIFLADHSRPHTYEDIAMQREELIKNHAAFRQLHQMYEEARKAMR
jgi:hypothetical protein